VLIEDITSKCPMTSAIYPLTFEHAADIIEQLRLSSLKTIIGPSRHDHAVLSLFVAINEHALFSDNQSVRCRPPDHRCASTSCADERPLVPLAAMQKGVSLFDSRAASN